MEFTFNTLSKFRSFFKTIIDTHSLEDLNQIPTGFNNNIIWNIGHVLVTQQLLAYKLSDVPPKLPNQLISAYQKGSQPEGDIDQASLETLSGYLDTTLQTLKEDYASGVFKSFTPYTLSTTGNTLHNIEQAIEFIAIHEAIHYGYVLALQRVIRK